MPLELLITPNSDCSLPVLHRASKLLSKSQKSCMLVLSGLTKVVDSEWIQRLLAEWGLPVMAEKVSNMRCRNFLILSLLGSVSLEKNCEAKIFFDGMLAIFASSSQSSVAINGISNEPKSIAT